jgi:hypothetical protein
MIDAAELTRIIEQYAQYGWKLRRAALSPESIARFGIILTSEDPEVQIENAPHESLWFSRRSLPDREAWELRRLSGSQFALVAVLEDSSSQEEREEIVKETEDRMFDGSHPEPTSH